jgi:hypothetical protein
MWYFVPYKSLLFADRCSGCRVDHYSYLLVVAAAIGRSDVSIYYAYRLDISIYYYLIRISRFGDGYCGIADACYCRSCPYKNCTTGSTCGSIGECTIAAYRRLS